MQVLENFHFLRPWWFVALAPLLWLLWQARRNRGRQPAWEAHVDAHLLPHLIVSNGTAPSAWPLRLLAGAWFIAVLALAGPVWQQLPEPLYRSQAVRILLVDLSRSMDTPDVVPTRLARAKFKVLDILERFKDGETGLVVFAGEPYVVSPLSADTNTISALVPDLATDLMPAQGSRPDLALLKVKELLANSGVAKAEILLVTDGAESETATLQAAKALRASGSTVSVLAIGTVAGAPLPAPQGGFITDENGRTVTPRLDRDFLEKLAAAGGGQFRMFSDTDEDINGLFQNKSPAAALPEKTAETRLTARWREEGYWLVLLLLPVAALAFRRGWLFGIVFFINFTPAPSSAAGWDDLWLRQDQQAARILEQGDPRTAAEMFTDPNWQGAAHYRAGDYNRALEEYAKTDTADSYYNRGNIFVKLGKFQDAINAYDQALKRNEQHADAKFNRELIGEYLKQQQQQADNENDPQPQSNGMDQSGAGKDQEKKVASATSSPSKQRAGGSADSQQQNADLANQLKQQGKNTEQSPTKAIGQESLTKSDREKGGFQKAESLKKAESQQAMEQWLRRIPDDPGGLLRRKFLIQHQRNQNKRIEGVQGW